MMGRDAAELLGAGEDGPPRTLYPGSDDGGARPSEYSGALDGGYGAGEDMSGNMYLEE